MVEGIYSTYQTVYTLFDESYKSADIDYMTQKL